LSIDPPEKPGKVEDTGNNSWLTTPRLCGRPGDGAVRRQQDAEQAEHRT
jgi:hypothetical protein